MSSLLQPFVSGIVDRSRLAMRVLYIFSRNTPTWCSQLSSNLANLEAIVVRIFLYIFPDNSAVARAQRAFQVSQSSVETLFRWGGKRLCVFVVNVFRKQILSELSEFCRRYYKKNILVSFFRTQYIKFDSSCCRGRYLGHRQSNVYNSFGGRPYSKFSQRHLPFFPNFTGGGKMRFWAVDGPKTLLNRQFGITTAEKYTLATT